jgi:hypothetical protein
MSIIYLLSTPSTTTTSTTTRTVCLGMRHITNKLSVHGVRRVCSAGKIRLYPVHTVDTILSPGKRIENNKLVGPLYTNSSVSRTHNFTAGEYLRREWPSSYTTGKHSMGPKIKGRDTYAAGYRVPLISVPSTRVRISCTSWSLN